MTGYAAVKAWRERNPEKWREQSRRYRERNADEKRGYANRWRADNPEAYRAEKRRFRTRRYLLIQEYQAQRGCLVCGCTDVRCLEFHHRDPSTKLFAVSQAVVGKALKTIEEEMAKCDVICANCHRILHEEEREC